MPYSTASYTLRKFKVTRNLENIQRSSRPRARIDSKIVNLIELNAADVAEKLTE